MTTIKAKDGTVLDRSVVTLAKAIRQVESNTTFAAKGLSGEVGAYQFMPGTWSAWSKEFFGNPNLEMSPVNQDKVAYAKILSLKNEGFDPKQIASIWNSGSPEWEGKIGTNRKGVRFDVPAYVNNVIREYKNQQISLRQSAQERVDFEDKEIMSLLDPNKVKEEEKKNNFFQDMLTSAISLPVNAFRIFKAGILTVIGTDKAKNEALAALDKPVDLGPLGIIDPLKEDREGLKQILGQTFQTIAWVAPVGKAATVAQKGMAWFGRGFLFSSGDALEQNKEWKAVVAQGAIGGLATATLGVALGALSAATSKMLARNSVILKYRTKIETDLFKKENIIADMRISTGLREKTKTVIGDILKSTSLSLGGQNVVLGGLTFFADKIPGISPEVRKLIQIGAGTFLAVRLGNSFLRTETGINVMNNVIIKGTKALNKVESRVLAPMPKLKEQFQKQISIPFYTDLINETLVSLRESLELTDEEIEEMLR